MTRPAPGRDAPTAAGARLPAVLALGSNLGDRMAHLQLAVRILQPAAVSPVYETAAVGGPAQGPFLNAVVLCDLTAAAAWERAQLAEHSAGRTREVRWGPRTLDVDVITADGPLSGPAAALVLPHPRAFERAFVLAPWVDLQPDAVLPARGPVRELLAGLDRSGIRRRDDLVLS